MTVTERFNDLVNRFYDDLFSFNPTRGREAGFHRYLGRVPDFSYENIMGFLKRLQFYDIEVRRMRDAELTSRQSADLTQLGLTVNYERFSIQQLRWWATNPLAYAQHLDVSTYMKRNYAPLESRAEDTIQHLKQIPHLLEQQRYNLRPRQSRVNLMTTIETYRGYADFYRSKVLESFDSKAVSKDIRIELKQAADEAVGAVERMLNYMESTLLPYATDDFAIGRFKYIDMLRFGEMVEMELEKLLRVGEADLERNQAWFEQVAAQLAPGKPPREVMLAIARNHPSPRTLAQDTRNILEEIRQFLVDRDLVTIPSDLRIQVQETPGFLRWAFAMCDTPGPYEKKATESFYYVTNVDPDWPEKKKEEWLTKFDYVTLDNVSIHEAYPGHFVHYLHSLSAPSKVAKIEWSYSFTEGWAHYAEEMMMEEGWHEDDPRYRLAQLSEALLRNCRYICSIKMHTQGMTVDEATQFLMENACMEETPARKEAERGTYDPGYLNYTLGKLMILKLREDWKKQEGKNYSLKRFHDTVLSLGAPPVPLARKLLLKNDDGEIL